MFHPSLPQQTPKGTHSSTHSHTIINPQLLNPHLTSPRMSPQFPLNAASSKTESQNKTNIQLYLPLSSLDKQKFSSVLSLLTNNHPLDAKQVKIDNLMNSQFPVLHYQVKELVQFSKTILETSQFCRINFPGKIVRKIVALLANNYHSVAYHNFSHAFSLMLLNFQCLQHSFWLKYLYTEEEYFYIMIAGLAHDINHPGTNNIFEIKTKSALANQYNNQSVLQNMHINHLWKILQEHPQLDFLSVSQDRIKAKKIITRLILNTDMSFHNSNLDSLKALNKSKQLDTRHNEHKWLLMEQVFHACDIGNSISQFDNYINWSALLVCEFSQQAKLEESKGIQVTKFLIFKGAKDLYKDQLWFVGNLVQPLWKQISSICPNLSYIDSIIQSNLRKVKQQLQKVQQS